MRTSANVLFCIIVLALTACGGGSFEKRLSALDSVLKDKPDSVYELLLGMEEEAMAQNKAGRMYYELMRADAQNKAYIDFTTDSVMKIVADYYDRHGSANEQMRAHYLLGCTYRDLKDVPMELQCFQEAVEKADTTKEDCNLYTLYAIYGQMADLYHKQYLLHEELNALEMCEKVAELDHDTISAIHAYELRMRAYILLNETDSVLSISQTSRKRYIEQGEREYAARAIAAAKSCLIDQRRFSEAKEYIDIYEQESGEYISLDKHTTQATLHLYDKGLYYLHENKIDSAQLCFRQLGTEKENEGAYKGLLLVYQQLHQLDSMAKYAILYTQASESGYINKNSQTIEQMTAMYNYGRHKQIAENTLIENAKIKDNNYILLITIILLVLGGTIIAMIVSNKHKEQQRKKAEELDLLAQRYNATKSQLAKAEEEKRGLLERMKEIPSESEAKIKEYEEKMAELQKRINTFSNAMMSYKQVDADIDATAWFHEFKSADIVKIFLEHLSSHNHNHNYIAPEEEWESLVDHFKNEARGYYDFITSRENNLSPLDIRVCMLSTLGFHTNEIANILDKSGQHITNVRKRIRERLSLSPDNSQKLDKALQAKLYSFIKK